MSRIKKKPESPKAKSNLVSFPDLEVPVSERLTDAWPCDDTSYDRITCVAYKRALFLHAVYELRGEYGDTHLCEDLTDAEWEQLKPLMDTIFELDMRDEDSIALADEDVDFDEADESELFEVSYSLCGYSYGRNCRELQIPYQPLHEYVLYGDIDDKWSLPSLESEAFTPAVRLALDVLDISEEDAFLDVDCGTARRLAWVAREKNPAQLYGVIPSSFYEGALAALRARHFGNMRVGAFGSTLKGSLETSYSIEAIPEGTKVDKLFAMCSNADWFFEKLTASVTGTDNANCQKKSWNPFSLLNEGGTLACLIPTSALSGASGRQLRQRLVERKMLRGVISLPVGMTGCGRDKFDRASRSSLLVVSHNEGAVRFVYANDLYASDWRDRVEFSDEDAAMAYRRYRDGGLNVADVSPDAIAEADWSLSPGRFTQGVSVKNSVPLGSLSLNITRGANLSASDLDQLASLEDTGFHYVRLSDIEDGRLQSPLPPINPIPDNLQRYCLQEGDLLISKSGAPFKIAVAHVKEGQTLLATGNLYIVRLDQSRILPSFAAAFLQSKAGIGLLESACSGRVTPVIALKALRSIPVPALDLLEQQRLSDRYEAQLDELEVLKKRADRIRSNLKDQFGRAI